MGYLNIEDKRANEKRWYNNHRNEIIEKKIKRKRELRDWFREFKSSLKCKECGFNHPAALQFHHRNPQEKEFEVCIGVLNGRSKESILVEIAKCDILCANCHAIKHYNGN